MKLDILVISAHPDDMELSCAGTVLKEIAAGKKVGAIDLTAGELGTRGSAEIRLQEAERSTKILGLSCRHNLGMKDAFFKNDEEHIKKLIPYIRKYQPEIVLTNAIEDRHPDHGRAAKFVKEACFYSGLRRIETSFEGEQQAAWRPKTVYHYIQDYFIKPDFLVDISPYIDQKVESIKAFSSQFFNPDSNEPESPLTDKHFFEFLKGRMADMGRYIQVDYAEGFTINRPLEVESLGDLK